MTNIKSHKLKTFMTIFLLLSIIFSIFGLSQAQEQLSDGETVYVPIYSNVYSGPRALTFLLSTMLSLRNTDPKYPITIIKADYYDDKGIKLESYIEEPVTLEPLSSTHFYIKEDDKRGGPSANFIVEWKSLTKVNQPIIHGVMLGMKSGQGVSFVCPGKIIKVHK